MKTYLKHKGNAYNTYYFLSPTRTAFQMGQRLLRALANQIHQETVPLVKGKWCTSIVAQNSFPFNFPSDHRNLRQTF